MRYLALSFVLILFACNTGSGLTTSDGDVAPDAAPWDTTEDTIPPDQEAPDLAAPDTAPDLEAPDLPDETVAPCKSGDGCFLDPCEDGGDCLSGWCVQHMGDDLCTQTCTEECPAGWSCKQVGASDPDVIFICVSDLANLCRPCAAAADCESLGGAQDVCVSYGPQVGSFCGGACEDETDCPEGYTCADVETIDGLETRQCVNDLGECPCTDTSVALVLWTSCEEENDLGTCAGMRVCSEEGLSACDAATPAAETCNGVDDDCNGTTDEDTCDDGNPCTEDTCLGEAGCDHLALEGIECLDGDPCTAADHCVAGVCVGDPVLCDDQNPCTDDSCTETGGCAHVPNAADCDDGDPCTVADECGDGSCAGTPVSCDCTLDADCSALEDGDLCNGTLVCDTSALPYQCVVDPNTLVQCPAPDGIDAPCQVTICDGTTGACGFGPGTDGTPCDNGDPCTMADTCATGACVAGATVNCNDGNPCTDDSCEPGMGCVSTANTLPCDDGSACTTGDVCTGGACVGGDALACDDGNPCTDDSCDALVGCLFTPNLVDCDDENACTVGDHCENGWCLGTGTMNCDDGNLCTDDSCAPETGCIFTLNSAPCDDGDPCTLGDLCGLGTCVPGPLLDCDDGNLCTTGDHCAEGACVFAEVVICDDQNLCTTDYCDPLTGCKALNNNLPCDDDDVCTTVDTCSGGTCVGSGALDCDDENPCTSDTCDPVQGCVFTAITPCCGNGITEGPGETCDDGNLVPGDGCDGVCQSEAGPCFQDWLVGTPCNGVDYGNGCVPADTGYHFMGLYSSYACFWHHKNQAWNTTTASNFYHLGLHFEVTPGVGKMSFCHNKYSTPTPDSYGSGYFEPSQVGAWGWCAESNPDSVGFVCIPHEGHGACN